MRLPGEFSARSRHLFGVPSIHSHRNRKASVLALEAPMRRLFRHLCSSGDKPQRLMRLSIEAVLIGVSIVALPVPAAYAQSGAEAIAQPGMESPGRYLVTFALDQATLTEQNRQVIAQAAEYYRQGGSPQVTVTGYTDTSGTAAHNLELSQRRAEVVAEELVREGVPATDIVTIGRGEEDLRVPTADGVREARNRRAEIIITQPPPAAVVAAPAPGEPEPMEEPERDNFFTIGPIYGHNFGETDDGGENDLVGANSPTAFCRASSAACHSSRLSCTASTATMTA